MWDNNAVKKGGLLIYMRFKCLYKDLNTGEDREFYFEMKDTNNRYINYDNNPCRRAMSILHEKDISYSNLIIKVAEGEYNGSA